MKTKTETDLEENYMPATKINDNTPPYSTRPTKPPLSKSKDRLMVARMSELARMSTSTSTTTSGGGKFLKGNDIERIAITDCSEC